MSGDEGAAEIGGTGGRSSFEHGGAVYFVVKASAAALSAAIDSGVWAVPQKAGVDGAGEHGHGEPGRKDPLDLIRKYFQVRPVRTPC